jgi:hypothetical protein
MILKLVLAALLIIIGLLSSILMEEHKHKVGALERMKPADVPVVKLEDDFRNYRQ